MFSPVLQSCHKCPNCCYNSTFRVKVTAVLGEVGSSGFEFKGSHNTERGLHSPLPVQTKSNQVTNCHKQLCQSTETVQPFGRTVSDDEQKCSGTGSKPKLTVFLQPAIFGTQTQQPVETYPGPEHLEHLPKHGVVQNGDPRDNKNLPTARGVGHLHRLQGRIFPYTNSQSVQEVHAFSHPGSVLSVQSPTLWPVHSTYGVHSGGQRGQRIHQYLDIWLVRATSHQTCLQHTQTLVALCRELGWLVNKEKSELDPKQVFNFVGYQFDLREGKVRPTPERWQTLTDKILSILSGPVCPVRQFMSLIGLLTATEKQVHLGRLHMRLVQWHLKNNWRVSESLEKVMPVPRSLHPHLKWWLEESNVLPGQPLHPLKHALQIFTDTSKEGWGAHLNKCTARGTWSVPESKLHINHLELKAVFLALKEFQDLCSNNWRVSESLEKVIPVPRSLHPHLKWWLEESNVLPGQPLHPLKHALQIFTDASKEGWGAHLNKCTARGTWSVPESKLHINHLELKAVFLALKEFQDLCSNNIVLLR